MTAYYLSTTESSLGVVARLGARRVAALKSRRKRASGLSATLPDQIGPGSFFVLACADDLRRVRESRERNNCRADPVKLEVLGQDGPPKPPVLMVDSVLNGTVTSSPSGINCGTDCAEAYTTGQSVTLTATADPGWLFTGWGGDCTGTAPCTLIMDGDKYTFPTYVFNQKQLTVSPTAHVTVTSSPPGIDCGSACSALYNSGQAVSLTATTEPGWLFTGWTGDCTGTGTCNLVMDADRAVGTAVAINQRTLTVSPVANGTVTSSPTGIDCGVDCEELYDFGQAVVLTATPDPGWAFMGWGGDCSGAGVCNLVMDADHSAFPTYVVDPP